jgi:acyl-CoA synthetase (AMP-forming)/AMP-acid ligase II
MASAFETRKDRNLGYWAHRAALEHPERTSIIDLADGERRLTHAQLEARLERVASALTALLNLKPGDRIAVGIGNRSEFVEVFFGAMRAGLVPIPLNLRQGRAHLEHALTDSGCVAAVVQPAANIQLPGLVENLALARRVTVGSDLPGWSQYEDLMSAASVCFDPIDLPPQQPAFQAYTSGSTGKPKGVVLSHEGQVWWIATYVKLYAPQPDECSLVAVPLYHKNAMAGVVKAKLPGGACMVLMPDYHPRKFLENLSSYRCTHSTGVPTIFSLALREQDLMQSLNFSALRSLTVGSAPVHESLHQAMEQGFGCPVYQSYGLTEGGPVMFGPPADRRSVPLGSCGELWPDCDAKLLGPHGQEHPRHGELWVRNPGVMLRYHNLPDVTAQRLKGDWLATGDLFERDGDNFWYFRGRSDDMFVCGGENLFPKEIENLLLTHAAVRDACVVPAPHPTKGEAPVALVVVDPSLPATEEELKQFCLANGPAYAHPRRIFVTEALPLNGAGKVDRAVVRARYRDALSAS